MKKTVVLSILTMAFGVAMAQPHIEYKWRGFYAVLDYSYGANMNRSEGDTLSGSLLNFVAGFQFRKEAGVGLGVSYVASPSGAYSQLPIYVELRSHFSRRQGTPYTVIQAGYSLPVGTTGKEEPFIHVTSGGLYFGTDIGYRYAFERSFAVGVHAGYKLLQSSKVERSTIVGNTRQLLKADARILHMWSLGLSLYF